MRGAGDPFIEMFTYGASKAVVLAIVVDPKSGQPEKFNQSTYLYVGKIVAMFNPADPSPVGKYRLNHSLRGGLSARPMWVVRE